MSIDETTNPVAPPMPPLFRPPAPRNEVPAPRGADAWLGLDYSIVAGFRALELDVYVPTSRSGAVGAVLWIHGGAWLYGDRRFPPEYWPGGALFQSLIDAGLAVATIDYRHSREAPFPAQLHDAKAALRYLRTFAADFDIDPARIGVWGESAGGHLAALLALTPDAPELEGDGGVPGRAGGVTAVVDFYGVSNLATMPSLLDTFPPEWIEQLRAAGGSVPPDPMQILLDGSPIPEADRERAASAVSWVTPSAPPFLLVHGEADTIVPFQQSVELRDRLDEAGASVELVAVPDADHVFLGVDPVPLIERGTAFLRRHLG